MRSKKVLFLLMLFLLTAVLCSCGEKTADLPNEGKLDISLQTVAGTGYYWDCALSEEGIVTVESAQIIPENLSSGSSVTTIFSFTGKKHGSVTANFYCRQSWDNSVFYQYTCDMEVDWDKIVTGELSEQTATIQPGDKPYKLTSTDSSVALWNSTDDISFTFSPMRSGYTVLTFTPLDVSSTDPIRSFYLRVADDNTITVTEQGDPPDTGFYTSVEELENNIGFSMNTPESATLNEISNAGGMGYINFTWQHMAFSYVGGELDLDAFRTPDASTLSIGEHEVFVSNVGNTVAAWDVNGIVYYISCNESIPREDLLKLLNEMILP